MGEEFASSRGKAKVRVPKAARITYCALHAGGSYFIEKICKMPKAIKIDYFRYMTNEAWRVLMAVEMGMKNHEFVPADLVHKISRCARRGSSFLKLLRDELVPHGLLAYETDARRAYSGYRLTNLGYDYLALHALIKSGQLIDLGSMIGAGKESDVYLAVAGDRAGRPDENGDLACTPEGLPAKGDYVVIKFHRLGRTSFRKVREKREYHQHRNTCSWLYLDRLAASREYGMMQVLYDSGLPVPRPLACNRNAVVMSLLDNAIPLCRVLPSILRASDGAVASLLYKQAVDILNRITRAGLVHGDFNEFNLLVSGISHEDRTLDNCGPEEEGTDEQIDLEMVKLILIDFPQMISRDHRTAQGIYERDLNGILSFFSRYLDIEPESIPPKSLAAVPRTGSLDVQLRAPGYQNTSKTKTHSQNGTDDSDVLVGNVASLALHQENEDDSGSGSDDETDSDETGTEDEGDGAQEDEDDEEEENSDEFHSLNSEEEVDNSADEEVESRGTITSSKMNHPVKSAADTLIDKHEVRERLRREEKKRQQERFRLRVKRQMRANRKKQARADVVAEGKMFG
ncbi:Serine/threonine-protein kinase RIO2 [Sparganum proliferum]